MSFVTNVVVVGFAIDDEPTDIPIVGDERGQVLCHVPGEVWGGTKFPETDVWVGALNYVTTDWIADSVRAYKGFWDKDQVLVVVEAETDHGPRVLEL